MLLHRWLWIGAFAILGTANAQPADTAGMLAPPGMFWNAAAWKRPGSPVQYWQTGWQGGQPTVAAMLPVLRSGYSRLSVGISTQFVQNGSGWVGSYPFQLPTGFPAYPNYMPNSAAPTLSMQRGQSASFLRMGELLGPTPQLSPRSITIGKAWMIR